MTIPVMSFRVVYKIGHSLGITIPKLWCKAVNLKNGDQLKVQMDDEKIVITKEEKCQKYSKK